MPRAGVAHCLVAVRAFYLDIAQWAAEDPARWAKWAARCPIRAEDIQSRKERGHRKSRMDQRTRERLPAVPALAAGASRGRELLPRSSRQRRWPGRARCSPPPGSHCAALS